MAMINCPECGREISDQAVTCPHCGTPIKKEDKKFCQHCGETIDKDCIVCPKCGKQVEELKGSGKNIIINNSSSASAAASANATAVVAGMNMISPKSRLVALLLCFFLGVFAIHRFYVGKIGTAILMIALMLTGIGEVWLVIDFITILLGSFKDNMGLLVKNW